MDKKEFTKRRRQLMEMMGDSSIAIMTTSPVRLRNRDVEFPFRPDSDFYYLTGFREPEAVAVIIPGRPEGEYLLFCREKDPGKEMWDGLRSGLEGACEVHQADDAFPIGDLDDIVPGLMEDRERVFYVMGVFPEFDQKVMSWVNRVRDRSRTGVSAPGEFVALDHLIHEMRLIKSRSEIKAIRRAMEVTVHAHRRAMGACRAGLKEFQLEAELLHEFMTGGSRSPAYPTIVGGGANGCILHYTENSGTLKSGDLVLVDGGAEFDYYAADITRTYPVNGRFKRAQKSLYEVVLKANQAAIAEVRPGNHWNEPHEAAVKVITEGLVELGLLKGRVTRLIRDAIYKKFYMHRTGHWLGMDVHDVGDYKVGGEWRMLEPGMLLTIEPGLYIGTGDKGIAPKWWNTGIRVEDNVLVTRDGCEVLSAAVPNGVDEIEELMGG